MNKHGTGAVKSPLDLRDREYKKLGRAVTPFDWDKGFSVEEALRTKLKDKSFRLKAKDQNGSGSCGGQACAYYEAVHDAWEKLSYTEKSAKDIYSQCYVNQPGGGSAGRTLMDLLVKKGACEESLIPSYEGKNAPSEDFMRQRLQTPATVLNASLAKGNSYARVNLDMDSLAIACRDNMGVLLGVNGSNNGTWHSKFPRPPLPATSWEWRHWVYVIGAKKVGNEKRLEIINSWGNVGEDGRQWLTDKYAPHFFEAWTLYDDYGAYRPSEILSILQKLLVLLGITKS